MQHTAGQVAADVVGAETREDRDLADVRLRQDVGRFRLRRPRRPSREQATAGRRDSTTVRSQDRPPDGDMARTASAQRQPQEQTICTRCRSPFQHQFVAWGEIVLPSRRPDGRHDLSADA